MDLGQYKKELNRFFLKQPFELTLPVRNFPLFLENRIPGVILPSDDGFFLDYEDGVDSKPVSLENISNYLRTKIEEKNQIKHHQEPLWVYISLDAHPIVDDLVNLLVLLRRLNLEYIESDQNEKLFFELTNRKPFTFRFQGLSKKKGDD